MAMARRITNAGAPDAFIARGLGRIPGIAAALVALLAYSMLQVALYGAFGPAAASQAAALGVHAPWWVWALAAWAVITVLGLLRVDITGKVLGVLTAAEIVVIIVEAVSGLASPAGGHLSFATLSPSALTSAGFGTAGVLAVVAVLGFTGFEQAPVLALLRKPGSRGGPSRSPPTSRWASSESCTPGRRGRWPPAPARPMWRQPRPRKAQGCCSGSAAARCRRPRSGCS